LETHAQGPAAGSRYSPRPSGEHNSPVGPAVVPTREAVLAGGASCLVIDDLWEEDPANLGWVGAPAYIRSVAGYLGQVASGAAEYLVVRDPDGRWPRDDDPAGAKRHRPWRQRLTWAPVRPPG